VPSSPVDGAGERKVIARASCACILKVGRQTQAIEYRHVIIADGAYMHAAPRAPTHCFANKT